ncbi:hypothetical protein [Burkholderia sp. Bp9143]|uniref:hypothetical protein n=1 Tax=Burkholderia sp. Bp9143 TaxID=2184574 RepID=UPI000F5ADDA9|nr:hypothetical protein [Burkholderia sp. Bp9143]
MDIKFFLTRSYALRVLGGSLLLCFATGASAVSQCGFTLPDMAGAIVLESGGDCSMVAQNITNPAGLNYLTLLSSSVADVLSDNTFFINEGGKQYFVNEDVDDSNVTIKAIKQYQATPIHFNGMGGFEERADFFVQVLPKAQWKDTAPYSGRVSCLIDVIGDESRSLKSRFCTPNTALGKKELNDYRSFLRGIK